MKKIGTIITLFLLLTSVVTATAAEPTIFTYRAPESPTDRRYDYDNAVLRLALEKTKAKWGEYVLVPSKTMNYSRAQEYLRLGELDNPMFKLSASDQFCDEFSYAPFPIDLGVVGYRLFFVSEANSERLSQVKTLADLMSFRIGQGYGWLDVDILEHNGFTVATIPSYESLFFMVADGRFDLFPRGANEVKMEYDAHKHIPSFSLNRDVGIYYPLPRFFFTNKSSKKAAQRVYEGLLMAYEDGSLVELWEKEYRPGLNFGQVHKVRFFEIENPFIRTVDPSYKTYFRQLH